MSDASSTKKKEALKIVRDVRSLSTRIKDKFYVPLKDKPEHLELGAKIQGCSDRLSEIADTLDSMCEAGNFPAILELETEIGKIASRFTTLSTEENLAYPSMKVILGADATESEQDRYMHSILGNSYTVWFKILRDTLEEEQGHFTKPDNSSSVWSR